MSFWTELELPIIGLSPMDGVTDYPFRHITKKYGRPAVVYTEFTSVEGVCHGAERLLEDFLFDETQRPIVAQIYGTTPQFFRETATLLCELGFDGIDINMGCPAKNVAHSGAGAALIKTPDLALEIIRHTKAGVEDYFNGKRARDCEHIVEKIWRQIEARHQQLPKEYQDRHLITDRAPLDLVPVSVKTRVGYSEKIAEQWISTLMEEQPAAIALHGRTLSQHYTGLADWEEIAKGAEVVRGTSTRFLGNGDVENLAEALEKVKAYGVDGVLIGRGTFGNPYAFFDDSTMPENHTSLFEIAVEHAHLYEKTYSQHERYMFLPMRKHLGWYVKGFPNAAEVRVKLFQANSASEVETVLREHQLIS